MDPEHRAVTGVYCMGSIHIFYWTNILLIIIPCIYLLHTITFNFNYLQQLYPSTSITYSNKMFANTSIQTNEIVMKSAYLS